MALFAGDRPVQRASVGRLADGPSRTSEGSDRLPNFLPYLLCPLPLPIPSSWAFHSLFSDAEPAFYVWLPCHDAYADLVSLSSTGAHAVMVGLGRRGHADKLKLTELPAARFVR